MAREQSGLLRRIGYLDSIWGLLSFGQTDLTRMLAPNPKSEQRQINFISPIGIFRAGGNYGSNEIFGAAENRYRSCSIIASGSHLKIMYSFQRLT
jgi:hypothetical protein